MKPCSCMSRSLALALVVLILSAHSVHAQPTSISSNLNGNICPGTVVATDLGGNLYSVTVTPGGVNVDTFIDLYSGPGRSTDFGRVYSPPPGRSIQGISRKNFVGGYYNGRPLSVIVLLDNETPVELDFRNFATKGVQATVLNSPGEGDPTKTFVKIVGDALYALGPSVFVSRDLGKTWQIDSTGLGGAFFRDIDLDTAQNVYAATTKGLFKQGPDSSVWHKVTTFVSPSSLVGVFIDRMNRIFVVASLDAGVFLSTDGGSSWSPDSTGVGGVTLSGLADDAFGNVYATGGKGTIYKSAGGTGPWTRIDAGISSITVHPTNIYAIAGDSLVLVATESRYHLSTMVDPNPRFFL